MTRKKIASVGECMLELSGGGETDTWRMGHAGDAFNTLWTIRALAPADWATDFVSAFGDDAFSAKQKTFFEKNGIGAAASPVVPGARPGLYAITLRDAERSFTYWRSDSAARRLADDPDALEKSLEDRALVYFSGITLAILEPPRRRRLIRAVADARNAGARIAFDPNYRPRLWGSEEEARRSIDEALAVTDIALPTFPDEATLYGDTSPEGTTERLKEGGVSEIVVKNGDDPAFVATPSASATIPAVEVQNPVDTTGAGDSFNGAYLAARLGGYEPEASVRKAHGVAAAVVRVHGALAPFATLRDAFA